MLYYTRIATPLGKMFAAASEEGLVLLLFEDQPAAYLRLQGLCAFLQLTLEEGENDHLRQLKKELQAYFAGETKIFSVTLHLVGTEFQKNVWLSLAAIPFGETISYAEQAAKLGAPKAVRAVASANSKNSIAIVLPCHRVISSDGTLSGYAGGVERKRSLIDFEKRKKGSRKG